MWAPSIHPFLLEALPEADDLLLDLSQRSPPVGEWSPGPGFEPSLPLGVVAGHEFVHPLSGDPVAPGDLALGSPSTLTAVTTSRPATRATSPARGVSDVARQVSTMSWNQTLPGAAHTMWERFRSKSSVAPPRPRRDRLSYARRRVPRRGLPTDYGRGFDELPTSVAASFDDALVRSLDPEELLRAWSSAVGGLLHDAGEVQDLAQSVEHQLLQLGTMP